MNDSLLHDLRYAVRSLRQRPGFAAVAVLTLALGIGANSAIFSVVNGVLLRPLPYAAPEELTIVQGGWETQPDAELSVSEYWDFKERQRSHLAIGAFAGGSVALTGTGAPERLSAGFVTADLLQALGVSPVLGRSFAPEEDLPGRPAVVLLSDGLWRRRFGADPGLVGRTILLDDAPATVLGIMPPGFQLPTHFTGTGAELWAPLQLDPATDRTERGWHFLDVVGRLRPGTDLATADGEAASLMAAMKAEYPGEYHPSFHGSAGPLDVAVVGEAKPALLVLLGAVALLLLIACANVAGLLLARGEARQREMALRTALGADRRRLVTQLLTESVVLALAGAALGLLLAVWALRALVLAAPPSLPRLDSIAVDGWVLGFTAAVAIASGIVFGLAPALHAARPDLTGALVEGGRGGTAGAARQRFRRGLVVAQIALALVLIAGAGLLVQSFLRLRAVDPGFDPEGVLTARVELSPVRYERSDQIRRFYDELIRRLEELPGVGSAAAVRALPMTGQLEIGDWSFLQEGRFSSPPLPTEWTPADWQVVTPEYFRTMGIPVLQGRGVEDGDRIGAPGAVVINQTLARQVWPAGDAVGQRILLGGGGTDSIYRTVVGVVGDVRHRGLSADPRPEMYLPHQQFPAGTGTPQRSLYVVVRSSGDPASLATALHTTVAGLDPDVPLAEVQTMEEALGTWAAERRLTMMVVTAFALTALLLGAVGIYGIMAHLVAQRTREFGIRMALGAVPVEILRLVLRQGTWLSVLGIAAGLVGALALTRVLGDLLFRIAPTDPLTLAGTAVLLALVAAAASAIPALRATRVDPIDALRSE
ncbi:MAG TPA: ABC transporter permease [Gemmatimonadales bacterium]